MRLWETSVILLADEAKEFPLTVKQWEDMVMALQLEAQITHNFMATLASKLKIVQNNKHAEKESLQERIEDLEKQTEWAKKLTESIRKLSEDKAKQEYNAQRIMKEHIKNFEHKVETCNPNISKRNMQENLEDTVKYQIETTKKVMGDFAAHIETVLFSADYFEMEDLDYTTSDISDIDDHEDQVQQLNRIECYLLKSISQCCQSRVKSYESCY